MADGQDAGGSGLAGDDQPGDRGISRRQLIKRGAVVGGAMVWTVPAVQTFNMATAHAQRGSPQPPPEPITACFLLIDQDSIDNGLPPNNFTSSEINDDVPGTSQRSILPFFNTLANFGVQIDLWTGSVGDEGWHAPQTIPGSWGANGLLDFIDGVLPQSVLDQVPDVVPLRAEGLFGLVGETILALVYDNDISTNYAPITGNLQGETLGLIAFEVVAVNQFIGGSSGSLPVVTIEIVDPAPVLAGTIHLCGGVPVPTSSSEPFDVVPGGPG